MGSHFLDRTVVSPIIEFDTWEKMGLFAEIGRKTDFNSNFQFLFSMFTGGFESFNAARRCQVDLSKPDDSDAEKQDGQQKPLVDNAHQDDNSQCIQSNLLCQNKKQ